MRILLISDSHQSKIDIDFSKYDAVIHCGDYGDSLEVLEKNNVHYVRGNCDSYGPKELLLDLFGRKIFITHGHYYDVKETYDRVMYRALELNASVCLFGHTHIPIWRPSEDLLTLNPGAYMDDFRIEITEDYIYYYFVYTFLDLYHYLF